MGLEALVFLAAAVAAPQTHAAAPPGQDHGHHGAPVEFSLPRTESFDFEPPRAGTYELPVIRAAANGRVIDTDGRRLSLHDAFGGKIVILSFIYTRCADPNGCPLATAALYDVFNASEADPEIAAQVRLLTLSFDPDFDTPEIMDRFQGFDPAETAGLCDWLFLTTASAADLGPILQDYGQVVRRRSQAGGGGIAAFGHLLRVYLIDRQKRVRNIYGLGFLDPRLLLADARTLLLEERAGEN